MADKSSTGAIHLTTIDLDISGVRSSLQEVESLVQETAEKVRNINFNGGDNGIGGGSGNSGEDGGMFRSSIAGIESLNLQYRNFLNTLSKSKLKDSKLEEIRKSAEEGAAAIRQLTEEVQNQDKVTKDQSQRYRELSSDLKGLKGDLADTTAEANRTGEGFKVVGNSANESANAVTRFVNALGDKVKWMAAYQVITLIRQSFGNVIETIRDTEDSVVALQRVLSSENLADSTISDRLYDIAYQYGQTFETVSDTFLKFSQTGLGFENSAKATEAAMLGLNTAELEVSTATNGLIAVMTQFGYEASDLELIIDKINTTADHFPVTSEKIVAALQRAGGTAKAFGLTLEETIGIITALSQATGRGGEQIGTALNSLISFSEKASSIKKFSEFLGTDASQMGVLQMWTALASKIDDSGEALGNLMASSEEFNELFDAEIADAIGLTEEFTKATEEEARGIYSTVGTYRQNYFIALLQNIDTVIKAMDNMSSASGYSMNQNEEAVQRLTAQWNQLVVSAKELAVQFGELGFLDLLKWLANTASSVLQVTKTLGGLRTALIGIVALLIAVKKEKMADAFSEWISPLKKIVVAFQQGSAGLTGFKAAAGGMRGVMGYFTQSVQGAATGITLLTTAIYAIVSAYQRWQQKQEELLKSQLEEGQAAYEQYQKYSNLQKELEDFNKTREETTYKTTELAESADTLVKKLQEEGIIIKKVDDAYAYLAGHMDEVNDEIREMMIFDVEKMRLAAEAASTNFEKAFQKAFERDIFSGFDDGLSRFTIPLYLETQEGQDIYDFLSGEGFDLSKVFVTEDLTKFAFKIDTSDVKSMRESISLLKNAIQALNDQYPTGYLLEKTWYQQIVDNINAIEEEINAYDEATNQYETYLEILNDTKDATEEYTVSIENNVMTMEELEEELESISEKYDEVKEKINEFSNSYSTLQDAVDEYNESGYLTADTLEKLLELEPEYIALLDVKNGQLSVSKDGMDDLANSTDAYMQSLVALKIAEETEALAKDIQAAATAGLTLEEYKAANASAVLNSELYNAVLGMINGTGSANDYANALANVANVAGLAGDYLSYFQQMASGIFGNYSKLLSIPRTYTPSTSGGSSGGGRGGSGSDTRKKALQEEINAWKDRESELKDYYTDLKKETEDYYDGLIDRLKEVQEENDRINDQLDYYNNRQKTITNLEQARSRSGIEWREKEMEYQQELIDLDDDWRRKQDDWDIKDQIDELKRLKEIAVDQIEETMDAAIEEIESVIDTLQDKVSKLSSSTASSVSGGIAGGATAGAISAADTFSELADEIEKLFINLSEDEKIKIANDSEEISSILSNIPNTLKESFAKAHEAMFKQAKINASDLYHAYHDNFISPISNDISNVIAKYAIGVMNEVLNHWNTGLSMISGATDYIKNYNNTSNKTVNMYANIKNTRSANATVNAASSLIGLRSNNF